MKIGRFFKWWDEYHLIDPLGVFPIQEKFKVSTKCGQKLELSFSSLTCKYYFKSKESMECLGIVYELPDDAHKCPKCFPEP